MATPTKNQAPAGPPANLLHDQTIPNTLGGIGPRTMPSRPRLQVGLLVVVVVVIVAVLVILVGR
jgi:hypothetical protein